MRLALGLALFLAGCATFDGPPDASIVGDNQGQLDDPRAPLVIAFSKPPVLSTLKFEIARYQVDDEGNLFDEDTDTNTHLDLLFSHTPKPDPGDVPDHGGTAAFSDDGASVTVTFDVVPPAATPLVLLIEAGLSDAAGVVTHERRRIVFTYVTPLTCNAPVHVVRSGTYFFVATVTKPIATHVNLWAVVEVDPATGKFKSRFTKAKRNPDPNRCAPLACKSSEVCRLLPAPACVAPSEPPGSADEFSDYVPDPDPPFGFGFAAEGCASDQDGANASFATAAVDVVVVSPPVTLRNAELTASFVLGEGDVLHGTGSLVADAVLLSTIDSGKGQGDLTARSLTDAEAPPGLQGP